MKRIVTKLLVMLMAFSLMLNTTLTGVCAAKEDGGSRYDDETSADSADSTDSSDSTDGTTDSTDETTTDSTESSDSTADTTDSTADDTTTDSADSSDITTDSTADSSTDDTTDDSTDTTTSAYTIAVPEGLEDGVYSADAIVEPDDDEGFNFYYITVAVTVSDGAITDIAVSGATGSNTQYSYRAESGIEEQITGKTAGMYGVDTITTATCSSKSIIEAINEALQGEPTQTTYTLGDSIYDPDGTVTMLTITNPVSGIDYSDITVAYAVGKFSSDLTEGTDYTVTLVSGSDTEIVYTITILSDSGTEIEDDDLTHSVTYNTLGQTLDVTVAGSSAGRITITSSATVSISDNILTLTGGNGETLADYIDGIDEITVSYTDSETGETVSTTYSTQWQHDVEPDYTGSDFFNEDGSINFSIAPFVYGAAGDYTITVSSPGFDDLTAEVGYTDIASAQIRLTESKFIYTGSANEPAVASVTLDGVTLTEGTDYTVSYSDNVDAGTATVVITAIGTIYTGTAETTFTITPKSIVAATVELSRTTYVYGAKERKPGTTVTIDGNTLAKGTDYTVTYTNNVNVGVATATITGTGNYTGKVTRSYTITGQAISKVTLSKTSYIYNGNARKPGVTVKSSAGKTLTAGTDYSIIYSGNTSIGTAKVTIKGKGNYVGTTIVKTFTIKPGKVSISSVKSSAAKKMTVSWSGKSGNVKYQIAYKVKGSDTWKYKTVSSSTLEKTITGLKSGKTYQVKVRAYKSVKGRKYYGSWSSTKTVKVK